MCLWILNSLGEKNGIARSPAEPRFPHGVWSPDAGIRKTYLEKSTTSRMWTEKLTFLRVLILTAVDVVFTLP